VLKVVNVIDDVFHYHIGATTWFQPWSPQWGL